MPTGKIRIRVEENIQTELRRLINMIAAIKNARPAAVAADVNFDGDHHKQNYRLKRVTLDDRRKLERYIDRSFDDEQKTFLLSQFQALTAGDGSLQLPIGEFIRALDFHQIHGPRLISECARPHLDPGHEYRGHYIGLRGFPGGHVRIARMRLIETPKLPNAVGFVTVRLFDENDEAPDVALEVQSLKVAKGVLFQYGENLYSLGQTSKPSAGLRFAKLRYISRADRTDLFGVRTGFELRGGYPTAHRIYFYAMRQPKSATMLKRLLAVRRWDDPILSREISNLAEVKKLLTARPMDLIDL